MLQFAFIASSAVAFALTLAPEPHSDWLYYWEAARDLSRYQRGGVGLGGLALLRWLGFSPVAASLVLNVSSGAALLWVAYAADRSTWKLPAQFVAGYLWMISPFYCIVQLDLVASAMLATAFWLLLSKRSHRIAPVRLTSAVILASAAVSTKPQLALVLWAMIVLLLVVRLLSQRRWPCRMHLFAAAMLASSLMGFAADYALRSVVGQQDSMRTSSAVTLYGGLLVSTSGQGCGYWSVAAAEAAKLDMNKPLHAAIRERLTERPVSHWASVFACKVPHIVLPPPYALYWALESPNFKEATSGSPNGRPREQLQRVARMVEEVVYRCLGLMITLSVWVAAWSMRRESAWAPLAPCWVLSFWAVHAIFEIQGRYFLPMFVIAPILIAFAVDHVNLKSGQPKMAA